MVIYQDILNIFILNIQLKLISSTRRAHFYLPDD